MILHKESYACFSHRVAKFIEHMAGDERHRRKTKNQVLGGRCLAGHNGSRELLMLLVGRGDKTAFRSLQRILSRLHLRKLKVAIFRSGHRNRLAALFCFCDGDAGLGKRLAGNRVYHRSRNLKGLAGLGSSRRRKILILPSSCRTWLENRQSANGKEYPPNALSNAHCDSPLVSTFRRRCSFWPAAT